MTPDRMEFHVGQTIYGQPLRLVLEKDSAGTRAFTLHRDEGNQRDDRAAIRGVRLDELVTIYRCAQTAAGRRPESSAHAELLAIHEAVMNPDKIVINEGDTFTLKRVKEALLAERGGLEIR